MRTFSLIYDPPLADYQIMALASREAAICVDILAVV
jgi:hypothetical protein